MSKYHVEESLSSRGSPHPDYARNLDSSYKFIENTKKQLLNGMSVKICDSQHLQKALLIISWTPPRSAPRGNCATPINLHQGASSFDKQVEGVFNAYIREVSRYEKTRPSQPEFEPVAKMV